jgi:hypothetical protein
MGVAIPPRFSREFVAHLPIDPKRRQRRDERLPKIELPHLTVFVRWGSRGNETPLDGEGLFDDAPKLLPIPLAGQGRFEAGFLPGGNKEGVPLHFTDDIFLLHFALEPTQGAFKRLIISEPNFCQ